MASSSPPAHRGWSRWLLPAGLALAVVAVTETYVTLADERAHRAEHESVLERASVLRARVESALLGNLLLAQGLVAQIATDPDIDQSRFTSLARELFEQPNQLRNVGAARDLIITHMYPLEGNEAALGLDYREVPSQREAALRARDTGELVVAGPLQLVQGGKGLIGRAPIFTTAPGEAPGSGPFWGLLASVIDVDRLLAHAGLRDPDLPLEIALRGVDGRGSDGAPFDGDPALFEGDAVLLDVNLPVGRWQMAAAPAGGWAAEGSLVRVERVLGAMFAATAALLIWLRGRGVGQRRAVEAALAETRRQLAEAVDSLSDGFALWDAEDRLVLCNARFRSLHRFDVAPVEGITFEALLRASLRRGTFGTMTSPEDWISEAVGAHGRRDGAAEVTLADGRCLRVAEHATSDGGTVGIYTDVSEIRRAEEDIRFRANFDPLTRLPNRARFLEQVDETIARARRSRRRAAILFIDLDRFKNINDSHGHGAGDALLVEAARRISASVRATDTVARLGGDEFTVILTGLDDGMAPTVIAESIIEALSRPFEIGDYEVYAGASVGITLCPDDGDDAGTLLRNADLAMYQAKEAGRGTLRYFTTEMTERARRFVSLEADLRRAIDRDELHLHFQPIRCLATGSTVGLEALARWRHPDRGDVSPGEFIPVAEESGLIVAIGEWVLREACGAARGLETAPRLSVNVSSQQFRAGFGAERVERILAETGLPAERLVLEITESLLIEDDERIRATLDGLRALGVGLAVDDFGTGYSSLSYLRRFPVTELKIDRSFVRDMDTDEGDARIVESVIAMARALDLTTVAEGVENERQRELLASLGCVLAQGYHLGRPAPLSEIEPARVLLAS